MPQEEKPKVNTSWSPYPRSPPTSPSNAETQRLAPSVGGWITKTDAKRKYKLAPSDLATILPISCQPNPHGGPNRVEKYNIADVEVLVDRLKDAGGAEGAAGSSTAASPPVPGAPHGLAAPNGPRILRTTAMKQYKLQPVQMDRLKPVAVAPNPHRASAGPMRHYNLSDVKALAESLGRGAQAPVRGKSFYTDDDYDNFNPFDGLSRDDAAALRKTVLPQSSKNYARTDPPSC
ncbi:hypothetical protein P7C70_g5204, partial [Phenoliferia sp. Uapishka_3]